MYTYIHIHICMCAPGFRVRRHTPLPWITAQVSTSARETLRTFATASQTLRRARGSRRALWVCVAKPWRPIQG